MPRVYFEYRLCKEFTWTLDELYAQPDSKINDFLRIMEIEQQFEQRSLTQNYGRKRRN